MKILNYKLKTNTEKNLIGIQQHFLFQLYI